jgi:hypothetical protein
VSRRLLVLSLAAAGALLPAAAAEAAAQPRISVLSNRADLISGGQALVEIGLPKRARAHVTLRARTPGKVSTRDVSNRFRWRPNGRYQGLVTDLADGRNVLVASVGSKSARAVIRNHPQGGPVISGPQLNPWQCQPTAVDAACNERQTYSFRYMPTGGGGFQPYDPKNPPTDVADTTTDQGVTVPFIIRLETGYMDRDQYKIAALYQPGKPWRPWAPQEQFNHKLLVFHGVSCGVEYQTGDAPDVLGGIAPDALGRGFATMSTALDYSGHNCNLALQAESLVMAKERIVESFGPLRYTIGTGCSGGSLAEQWIANAYPGVYQGILPTCSFPDAWSTASQFLDYHLLLQYFFDPSRWAPGVVWLPTQMAQVAGHATIGNAEVSETAQFHVAVPTDACAGTTSANRYNPQTNPGGVRCDVQDAAINIFGPNPQPLWSPNEIAVGHGFGVVPVDNVGVQYGLSALAAGQITPAQFVDLNAKLGGVDIDANATQARLDTGATGAIANAYRSGMINEANNLDRTAIIDCRGPDPGAFHDAYRAFAVRARLDRANGNHANQLIWEGPAVIIGDAQCEQNSFDAMDRWLSAVEKDRGGGSLAKRIARDKPRDLGDRCYDGAGQKVSDGLCPDGVVPIYGTPRTVAGDAITTDTNKCQLKPLAKGDYSASFTDAEWAQLEGTFPTGVCDYSKPGVDQQDTIAWQTYQRANGKVIYGGKPLGRAPTRSGLGWTSRSFRSWTRG